MIPLRAYQQRTVTRVRGFEARGDRRLCVHGPTGSGKGVVIADLLLDDIPQYLLTHRRVLLDQLAGVLQKWGVPFGMRASGCPTNPDASIQLGMIQTESARVFRKNAKWGMHRCDRLLVDELHANTAAEASKVFGAYQQAGASLVGFTATPTELRGVIDRVVTMATVSELIQLGHLVPPVVYTPDGPDVDALDRAKVQSNGEYGPKELAKLWSPEVIFGRVVEHYHRLNPARTPTILFAPGVPSSLWYAQKFSALGVPAAHVDGRRIWVDGKFYDSDTANRRAVFERLRTGELKILTNRFVLREGLDLPEVAHVILATVFGTRQAFVQACGRGLRPADGKDRCVFQDHGGNAWRFPALDAPDPWDVFSSAREQQAVRVDQLRHGELPEPIVCPECDCLRVAGPECPECGHRSTLRARKVVELSGRLRLAKGRLYKPRPIRQRSDDQVAWDRVFWSAYKNRPDRTLRQCYTWHAANNNWGWLPRDLKLMPPPDRPELWGRRVGELDLSQLRG